MRETSKHIRSWLLWQADVLEIEVGRLYGVLNSKQLRVDGFCGFDETRWCVVEVETIMASCCV